MQTSNVQATRLCVARCEVSGGPVRTAYDGLLVDLDGTLFRGSALIPGAPEALRQTGLPVVYVTNNASTAPEKVAERLRDFGYDAPADSVMTSAQAAVSRAAQDADRGTRVLIVGAPSFADLARTAGFTVVESADEQPEIVFQGLNKSLTWSDIAEGALAIQQGARWIASNMDTTLPTERGLLPGNGSFVAAMRAATGAEPEVAGKPEAYILQAAAKQLCAKRPLVIGDRLDTDIAGACAAEMDSMLVLTGVSTEVEARQLPVELQPTYLAPELRALNEELAPFAQGGTV